MEDLTLRILLSLACFAQAAVCFLEWRSERKPIELEYDLVEDKED